MKSVFSTGLICLILACFVPNAKSQIAATRSAEVTRAAAKIMVVPYSKQDENVQTVLDNNPAVRTAVSKVKEAFDQRGWSTVDFVANLRAAQANSAFTADRQSNFKSDLLSGSGADFYVQVDVQNNTDDSGTNITLNVTAFETHTGASFSNQTASSGRFVTNDVEKLITRAFEKMQEEFMNNLMVKTDEIRDIGRALVIHFNLDENCAIDFDSEIEGGKFLNEAIEEWVSASAFRGRANLAGIIENKMVFDEVRIPLFDQETDKPFNPNKFANEIIRFLKSKNINATRNIKGQSLFITIK
ncbi:DUF6175 family protein [Pedobacter gandavensis]|uniref:DUF541 domain-containing protein n=1 Tax=Pedobacter gandavensis TaxID=2679963 RepID=A0ABR6F3V5_9SPHI|nr:DUF6175 family protein [Pedobacter gandavensis]MBB2151393.1 hypothetical protein [Pedobacter gandavensis]